VLPPFIVKKSVDPQHPKICLLVPGFLPYFFTVKDGNGTDQLVDANSKTVRPMLRIMPPKRCLGKGSTHV
jgi:hypothetical protein